MNKLRFITTLFALFLIVSTFAKNNDITMVSYEQSWLDSNGTIALKNNTNKKIKNVVFQITYLDMSGNELDYEEFTKNIEIEPNKTKKLDISAYEHNRNYHYYKTPDSYGHTLFKIKFKLIDYNIKQNLIPTTTSDILENNEPTPLSFIIFVLVIALFSLGITIGAYVLVAIMAQKRNRNVAL